MVRNVLFLCGAAVAQVQEVNTAPTAEQIWNARNSASPLDGPKPPTTTPTPGVGGRGSNLSVWHEYKNYPSADPVTGEAWAGVSGRIVTSSLGGNAEVYFSNEGKLEFALGLRASGDFEKVVTPEVIALAEDDKEWQTRISVEEYYMNSEGFVDSRTVFSLNCGTRGSVYIFEGDSNAFFGNVSANVNVFGGQFGYDSGHANEKLWSGPGPRPDWIPEWEGYFYLEGEVTLPEDDDNPLGNSFILTQDPPGRSRVITKTQK